MRLSKTGFGPRRVVLVASMVVGQLALGSSPAGAVTAHAGTAPPRIVDAHWEGGAPRAGHEANLEIRAVDPDGVVIAVWVVWGDGWVAIADLFCLPDSEVGAPVRLSLSHTYESPGRYQAKVLAESLGPCDDPGLIVWSPFRHVPTDVRPG
jgi:hypothetical protein